MGKHDVAAEKKFSWDPPKDDFYKHRINALEAANDDLQKMVRHLELEIAREELADEQGEAVKAGIIAEFEEEIKRLKDENEKLKEALVKALIGD